VPKQTPTMNRKKNPQSAVPPAAPRGLNQEIGTVNFMLQNTGSSARTAFVAPFQEGGTQDGQGQEDRDRMMGVGIGQ
jgi:hypothetical protein